MLENANNGKFCNTYEDYKVMIEKIKARYVGPEKMWAAVGASKPMSASQE
jgi:hypothetical protein